MNTPFYVRLALLLATIGMLVSAAAAQDAAANPAQCHFALSVDPHGTATFNLILRWSRSAKVPKPDQVEQILRGIFPQPVDNLRKNSFPHGMMLSGRVIEAFPPVDARIAGELELGELADLVQPLGVSQILVWVQSLRTDPRNFTPTPPQSFKVATDNPEPVYFTLQGPPRASSGPVAILPVLFLAPLGVLFWRRRATLKHPDRSLPWYHFWRWCRGINLVNWLVWLTAVPAVGVEEFLTPHLPSYSGAVGSIYWTILLLPPWFMMSLINTQSQAMLSRLTGSSLGTREIVRRSLGGLLRVMIPIVLMVYGVIGLMGAGYRAGAPWLAAAVIIRLVAARLIRPSPDLRPHALTFGELRDRIFTLAGYAGVTLKQIYLVPTGKMPFANAFAVNGGNVLMTDHLLRHFTRREVEAIAAHELGHLRYGHPGWIGIFLVGGLIVNAIASAVIGATWPTSWLRHVPLAILPTLLLYYFMLRRFEYQTDGYAAWMCGDPEALITGLVKLQHVSFLPLSWGPWEGFLLTHPSTSMRVEAIARANGVCRKRLQELIEHPELADDRYPLPASLLDPDLIFSPAFKARSVQRIAWSLIAALVVTPALAALAVYWTALEDAALIAALVAGAALTVVTVIVLHNYVPLWGYAEVRRRLKAKLQAQGIDPEALGGIFVSFAPDPSPRMYESYTNWDFGFLFLQGERLCYVGEQTRFALRRDQVTDLRRDQGVPRWWPVQYLYVSWHDAEQGKSGTFNVRAGQVRSMRQLDRATAELAEALRRWWEEPTTAEVPAPLAELAPPCIGEVTSAPVESLIKGRSLFGQTYLLVVLGAALSYVLGLPFGVKEDWLGAYVPLVAGLALWISIVPVWWRCRRAAKEPVPLRPEEPRRQVVAVPADATEEPATQS